MKILLLSLLSLLSFAQIDMIYYKVHYNESYPGPTMVEYTISKILTPDSIKRVDKWVYPIGIKTPKLNDWKTTGYDRGHLAPAETFSQSNRSIESTFSLLNCSFQHWKLNRETWRLLERAELNKARTDSLKVYTGCLYQDKNKVTKRGIIIPSHFWRIIINHTQKTIIAFKYKNEEVDKNFYTGIIDYNKLLLDLKKENITISIPNYRQVSKL